jgi:integrase
MITELTVTHTTAEAGIVANHIAARNVFADYQQRKSSNSLRAQYADLATFAGYLSDAGIAAPTSDELQNDPDAWEGMTWGLVAGFVQWMLRQGLALASINRKLSTVKVYGGLAAQAGVISGAELALIKTVKGYAAKEFKRVDDKRTEAGQTTRTGAKKAKGVVLTPEQAKALKIGNPLGADTPQGRRDAVIMTLLLDHGLRVGELAALRVTDVDLAAGELRFYRPKVAKAQTHRLGKDARAALVAYMPYAPALGPLLRGSRKGGKLDGYGMTERSITIRVGELGAALGIEGLSAHDCRHYWTTRAIRRGADPFAVLQAGGWTSMATVQKYVDETAIANEGIPGDDYG